MATPPATTLSNRRSLQGTRDSDGDVDRWGSEDSLFALEGFADLAALLGEAFAWVFPCVSELVEALCWWFSLAWPLDFSKNKKHKEKLAIHTANNWGTS